MAYKRILNSKMVDYGDACHRKRSVLVGFKRAFPGAYERGKPVPRFRSERPHWARGIACDDAHVPEEDKSTQPLHVHVVYEDVPVFGEIKMPGRLYPGYAMGPGHNPSQNGMVLKMIPLFMVVEVLILL